jgi:hypothetical protein
MIVEEKNNHLLFGEKQVITLGKLLISTFFIILGILLLLCIFIRTLNVQNNGCKYEVFFFKIINKTPFLNNTKKISVYFILLDPLSFLFKNDVTKVGNIRNTISCLASHASQTAQIKKEMANKKDAWEMLKFVIQSNNGGLDCSGYSTLLLHIYEELGYPSVTYHHGRSNSFNHVVTLVRIYYEGRYIWSIQDGLFNLSIMDRNNKPIDFILFIQNLATNGKITYDLGPNRTHVYYCTYDCSSNISNYIKHGHLLLGKETIEENELSTNINAFLFPRRFQYIHSKKEADLLYSQMENILIHYNIKFDPIY